MGKNKNTKLKKKAKLTKDVNKEKTRVRKWINLDFPNLVKRNKKHYTRKSKHKKKDLE